MARPLFVGVCDPEDNRFIVAPGEDLQARGKPVRRKAHWHGRGRHARGRRDKLTVVTALFLVCFVQVSGRVRPGRVNKSL